LAIAATFHIEPLVVITEKVVKPATDATRVFQEAQVRGHPLQHLLVGLPIPETNAKAQRPSIVVGGVAALSPWDTVDGMLDQTGRVRHAIQMIQCKRFSN
jgi:hypothetical protein